jgi:hypothetical protein
VGKSSKHSKALRRRYPGRNACLTPPYPGRFKVGPGGPSAIGTNSGKLLLASVAVTRVPNYCAKFVALVLWHWFCLTPHVAKMRPGFCVRRLRFCDRVAATNGRGDMLWPHRRAFADARPALMANLTERRRRSPSARGLRPRQTNQRPGFSMCLPSSSSRSAIVGPARDDLNRCCRVKHFRRESRS